MKKLWVIPLIIVLFLFLALSFRWEKGPSLTKSGKMTVYLKDRWTGQKWYKLYGQEGKNVYFGNEYPSFDEGQINSKTNSILNGSKGAAKKTDIEKKIKEAEYREKLLIPGHEEEIKYGNYLKSEYERIYGRPKPLEWEWYKGKLWNPKDAYVDKNMPNELHDKYLQWKDAHDKLNDLINDKKNIATWAKSEATKELTSNAIFKRKFATYVFITLEIILVFSSIVIYIFNNRKKRKMKNEEVII